MGWTTQQYKASRREHREVLNALMIFEQVTLDDLSRAMGEKTKDDGAMARRTPPSRASHSRGRIRNVAAVLPARWH
jgi:hypothetical protein